MLSALLAILRGLWQMAVQSLPPKPKWTTVDIPDLTNQVIIVTGGNTGIGKETVRALLEHNAKVYLAARSKRKAEEAIAELKAATGNDAIFLELDLASLVSVRKAAEEFLGKESSLNVLFNNAGVMACPIEYITVDGFDMQFGTNVVGHYFFTQLLKPALLQGAQSSPDRLARVVNTASIASYMGNLHWNTFKDGPARRRMSPHSLYLQSKFGNAVFAIEFARRHGDKGIVSTALNPGNLLTDLTRYMHPFFRFFVPFVTYPASMGALTQLWAGTSPETKDFNGKFLIPWARLGRCREEAYDPEIGTRLYEWLQDQVKGY